jgi:hypothetical protein
MKRLAAVLIVGCLGLPGCAHPRYKRNGDPTTATAIQGVALTALLAAGVALIVIKATDDDDPMPEAMPMPMPEPTRPFGRD